MTWYEYAQGWIAGATLPVTLAFLVLFTRRTERWWTTWFGRSLFLLALGVLLYSATTVLYRTVGDYPGRPGLLIASTALVFVAMTIRTVVLWRSQRTGHRLPNIADAPIAASVLRDFDAIARHIEHLDPCPDPQCVRIRGELVDLAHRLPNHQH